MSDPKKGRYHETHCTRCGICCYMSVRGRDGSLRYTPFHCEYLDPVSKLCTVWEERFTKAPWCRTAAFAAPKGDVPTGCPYLYGLPGIETKERVEKMIKRILSTKQPDGTYRWHKVALKLDENWSTDKMRYPEESASVAEKETGKNG